MKLLPLFLASLVSCEQLTVTLLDQTHSALSQHAENNHWNSHKLSYSKTLAQSLVDHLDHDINYLYGETKKFAVAGGNSLANYLDVSSGASAHDHPLLIVVNSHETPEFDEDTVYHAQTLRKSVTEEMRGEKLASVVRELMDVVASHGLQKRNSPQQGYCGDGKNCPVFCPGCLIEDLGEGDGKE